MPLPSRPRPCPAFQPCFSRRRLAKPGWPGREEGSEGSGEADLGGGGDRDSDGAGCWYMTGARDMVASAGGGGGGGVGSTGGGVGIASSGGGGGGGGTV